MGIGYLDKKEYIPGFLRNTPPRTLPGSNKRFSRAFPFAESTGTLLLLAPPLPSFTTPSKTWYEGVRFAVFGAGSLPLLLEDLSNGNIGGNSNEVSEES